MQLPGGILDRDQVLVECLKALATEVDSEEVGQKNPASSETLCWELLL